MAETSSYRHGQGGWLKLSSIRSKQDARTSAETDTRKIFGKKLWYVFESGLGGMSLSCYNKAEAYFGKKKPKGLIPLRNLTAVHPEKDKETCIVVACDPMLYVFECNSAREAQEWTAMIKETVPPPPPPPRSATSMLLELDSKASFLKALVTAKIFQVYFDGGSRINFRGYGELRLCEEEVSLFDPLKNRSVETWYYKFIRRYTCRENEFGFEAGRRCHSGEGLFFFTTTGSDSKIIYDYVTKTSDTIAKQTKPRFPSLGSHVSVEKPATAPPKIRDRSFSEAAIHRTSSPVGRPMSAAIESSDVYMPLKSAAAKASTYQCLQEAQERDASPLDDNDYLVFQK